MMHFDYIIVMLVLISTICVGLFASKKVSSLTKFSVGDRNYSSITLFITLVASYMGAGFTFGLSGKTFELGVLYVIGLMGFSLQQLLVGMYIAPRVEPFRKMITVGDILQVYYGTLGRKVAGVASLITCSGMLGAQVSATGYVFNIFLGLDQSIGIFIGCGIVVLYSMTGGIRAGIATDILQFILLMTLIPLAAILGLYFVGGFSYVGAELFKHVASVSDSEIYINVISIFFALLIGETLIPSAVQRLLITKNVSQTVTGTVWSALISIPFFALVGVAGVTSRVIDPSLDPNLALPFLIDTVMPIGLRGLAIASIIAVIMSSADAYLNSGAVSVVRDLIDPIFQRDHSKKTELLLARLSTMVMGVIAILFAISIDNVLDVLLYSYTFWSPVILVPLVCAFYGIKISKFSFLVNGVISFVVVFCWQMYFSSYYKFDGLILGVLINGILFFLSYKLSTREKTGT